MRNGNLDEVKNVISLFINWEEYAKLYHRATGNSERLAKLQLNTIHEEFSSYRVITPSSGYMIEIDGKPFDFIQAFPGPRTRLVDKQNAIGLARVLGYSEKDVVFVD